MASTAVLFGSAHSDNGGGDFLLLYIHGRGRNPVSFVSTLVNGLLRMVDHRPTFCIVLYIEFPSDLFVLVLQLPRLEWYL